MMGFVRSLEFWVTLILIVILLKIFGLSDLANYIQIFSVFQFSYIIHRLHKHHILLQSMMEDDEE